MEFDQDELKNAIVRLTTEVPSTDTATLMAAQMARQIESAILGHDKHRKTAERVTRQLAEMGPEQQKMYQEAVQRMRDRNRPASATSGE